MYSVVLVTAVWQSDSAIYSAIYVCVYIYVHVYICIYTHIHIYVQQNLVYVCTCMCTCICTCTCICACIYMYIHIYIYSRTLLFIHSIYKSSHLLTPASHSISLCTLGNHQSVLHVLDSVSA